MVDDERMRLAPGEVPQIRTVRFRTLGLLPAHRRDREHGEHAAADHPRDAPDHDLRTPGPGDRPRFERLDGEEEAGGVLLMAHAARTSSPPTSRLTSTPTSTRRCFASSPAAASTTARRTLIGRLLYDSKLVFEDHLAALEADSKKLGTQGGELDFALLVDGLAAEREQGITIDVAYRFFSTERRKFIVADTPGHEQYTRNMVTGASTADLAVILVDARKGVLTQTRRHSFLVSLLGIRKVVLAVNKLDLVDYSQRGLRCHRERLPRLRRRDRSRGRRVYPGVGPQGRQHRRAQLAHALVLRAHAHRVPGDGRDRRWGQSRPFRMPVQWVNRPDLDFRGFSGQIVGGIVRPGRPGASASVGSEPRPSHAWSPRTAISTLRSPASQ